ncbi:hypothetical protein [Pseudorhodobacter turbinis]|uniref:hypothetical protein n=1 Tax=Pseudorhodobacter turbinis TaxID=2500533 RepID=UPI001F116770|nr:hypothetical protein [Pseudorhodobacter turbinis]
MPVLKEAPRAGAVLAGVWLFALVAVVFPMVLAERVEVLTRLAGGLVVVAGCCLGGFTGSSNAFHARLTAEAVARRTFALARVRIFLNVSIIGIRSLKPC